jgi:phosphate uptake regulator
MTKNNFEDEEIRKIQFSGKSSYVLALPKKWVEEMGLSSGDQVIVSRQSSNSLSITPKDTALPMSKSEVLIEATSTDSASTLTRKIISAYLLGYNVIDIVSKGGSLIPSQRTTIKEDVRRRLVGAEVIADSAQEIIIQVLISFSELSVESALRRMFLIAASMHRDSMDAFGHLDFDLAKSVTNTDDEVDRFNLYIVRQLKMAVQNDRILKEIGLTSPRDCLGYRLIVKSVERVADHASKIAQETQLIKKPLNEETFTKIKELSEFALKVFEDSGLALFKRDYNAADQIIEKSRSITDLERKLIEWLEKNETIESLHSIRLIIEDIRRTAELASDVAEVVLNMTAQKVMIKE